MLSLLTSPSVQTPLRAQPAERYPAVFRALTPPGRVAPPSEDALRELAGEVFRLKAAFLRPILASVVQAGGLGPMALALERHVLGTSEEDYARARQELIRLEEGMRTFLRDWDRSEDFDVRGSDAFRGASRYLGTGEGAAPAFAFLWSVISNLSAKEGFAESQALEIASQIHSGSAHHLAYRALMNHDRPEAEGYALEALEKNPLPPLPHAFLATVRCSQGRYEDAVASFEAAWRLAVECPRPRGPTGVSADFGMADVVRLGKNLANALLKNGFLEDGERVLAGVLDLAPDDASSLLKLGTLIYFDWNETPEGLRSDEDLEMAETLLKAAIAAATDGSETEENARHNLDVVRRARRLRDS